MQTQNGYADFYRNTQVRIQFIQFIIWTHAFDLTKLTKIFGIRCIDDYSFLFYHRINLKVFWKKKENCDCISALLRFLGFLTGKTVVTNFFDKTYSEPVHGTS